jgi:hypothetical protein
MRLTTIIIVLLLTGFKAGNQNKYELLFPEDYADAKQFVKSNCTDFKNASFVYKHGFLFSTAIVFPELLRYSVIKDIMETTALELVYVNHGAKAADFSIGRFQMKPSFIESVENEILKNDSLSVVYQNLLLNQEIPEQEQRQIRVNRLKSYKWQINYLHAFIAICDERFKYINFKNINDKLTLYATAYNSGFYQSAETLLKKAAKKCFPYGEKYEGTQYAYCDISNYYFNFNH